MSSKYAFSILNLPLTKELVEALDALIPEKCPSLNESERAIFYYAGQRSIVAALKYSYEEQQRINKSNTRRIGSDSEIDRLAGL